MLYLLDANILITAANTYYGISRVPEFLFARTFPDAATNSKILAHD